MNRKEYVEAKLETMIGDVCRLVEINSACDPDTAGPGAPFGAGPAEGLAAVLAMADGMGMKTVNYDGYAGEITVGGGNRMIGILVHVDVVEAGPGWNTPPFEAVVRDGRIFGRGSLDDKGPVVSCLYAMRYIVENDLLPEDCSIRMIVGADEEEGLRCIDYYVRHAERLPDVSFVPDGYFPMVNCEKGLMDFDMTYRLETGGSSNIAEAVVEELSGGMGRNVVPAEAKCRISFAASERGRILEILRNASGSRLQIKELPEGCVLTAQGVSAHAMSPEKGRNAVSLLLCALKDSGIRFSCQDFIDAYTDLIGMEYDGTSANCRLRDEVSGELTLNVGTLALTADGVRIQANLRYPVSFSHEEVRERLFSSAEAKGFSCSEELMLPPLYIEKDDPLVRRLMEAYREITGDMENDMFSIGGATYARSIPNAISFGPLFPYETELAHEANEFLSVDSLKRMTEIYILALEKLLR